MAFVLDSEQIVRLCNFVDQRLRRDGCDHSHRFSRQWATEESVDWDDLLDVFEANGAFCDCEVVLNLPEDVDLDSPPARVPAGNHNPWLLPPGFEANDSVLFTRWIVSRADIGRNTHTAEGELLIPAPRGAKPKGRIRKSVHFFVGCRSGKASEVGVVQACEPIPVLDFAQAVIAGGIDDLSSFGTREAAFVLSRIATLSDGTTVGTGFSERVGVASKHEELTIHRIVLRR